MKKYFSFLLSLSFILFVSSCTKSNIEPEQSIPYQKIGEAYAIGAATKVELYAKQALTTGYNTVYIALSDSVSNGAIENAEITLLPLMDMGTMKHSAPVENPAPTATNNLFGSGIVFTMASGSMGSWTVEVAVQQGGKKGKATVPLTVTESVKSRLKSFISKVDNSKYIVALVQPEAPKVGVNDLELAIYKVKNGMEYSADSSLTVTLTPEMPTMGHGSPNNVSPTHTTKGHYKGKVNFTMTGLWHLNIEFKSGTSLADAGNYFEINF